MTKSNISEVKNFWNARPCNIRHSSKEIGTKEYFDEVERKKFFVEPHILSFTDFKSTKNKKVLEIGCGIGTAAINFARAGSDYTGVELSEESLSLTKKRFDVYGQVGNFFLGNAEELSSFLPDNKYDLIYSFGVIHHSPNPEKIISELKKYMHKETELKIMLCAKNSWKNILIDGGIEQPEAQYGCPVAYTYSDEDVTRLLGGFKIETIMQDHIFPYEIEPYKNNEFVKVPWFNSMPDTMFKLLEKKLGWHMLITARLGEK